MNEDELIGSWQPSDMVEITLAESDDFSKVRETLTRIGVASKRENKLYQSCHILHKQGKYYIVHFKELFMLDAKPTNLSVNDVRRRNTITNLLNEWDLISIVDSTKTKEVVPVRQLKILSYSDKTNWELCTKYNIGSPVSK